MTVLCDTQIRELIPIEPFEDNVKRSDKVSFGVSSYGYDVRVGTEFKVFTDVSRHGGQAVVDLERLADQRLGRVVVPTGLLQPREMPEAARQVHARRAGLLAR